MDFWTVLVLFLTCTRTCYMQPYEEALNSVATRIFPPGQFQRDHLSSIPSSSFRIPKKRTGVLKKNSLFQKLAAYKPDDRQFPSKPETPPLERKDMYVPFDYQYTTKTEEFLTSTTEKFNNCLKSPQQMSLFYRLKMFLPNEKDVSYSDATPFYQTSMRSHLECHSQCSRANVSYVKFLNESVRQLSEHFFSGEICVKLHVIDAHVSDCVPDITKQTCDCKCKPNYQITIIRNFYEHVINILNGGNINHGDIRDIDYFVTVLFFLKFHPRLAAHYIAFVFFIYKLRWIKNDRLATYPDLPFVPPDVEGKVEEIYSLRFIDDKLFQRILLSTTSKEFHINIFAAAFQEIFQR